MAVKPRQTPQNRLRSKVYHLPPYAYFGPLEWMQDDFEREAGTSLPMKNWFGANSWRVYYYEKGNPVKKCMVDPKTGKRVGEMIHLN
jgi:hypothetical protein